MDIQVVISRESGLINTVEKILPASEAMPGGIGNQLHWRHLERVD